MKSVIVAVTTGAVVLLDSKWSLVAAVASGLMLFVLHHHSEHRHSPYREGWY